MPTIQGVWDVIVQFDQKFFTWWETPFIKLKVDELEESSIEWTRKLTYVTKDENYMSHDTASSWVFYIQDQLERLKDFLSIFAALKTRGLEKRHYHRIEYEIYRELKVRVALEPNTINLKYVSEFDLHSETKSAIVKKHAAIA
jgi:hypothetical protein